MYKAAEYPVDTGGPTNYETSETIVRNLFGSFLTIQGSLHIKTGFYVLNHLLHHLHTKLKAETRNQSFKLSYFKRFGSSLQSHLLWLTLYYRSDPPNL